MTLLFANVDPCTIIPNWVLLKTVAVSSVQESSLQVGQPRTQALHELPQWCQYEMLINTEQPVPGIRVGADPKELGIARQLRLWLLSATVRNVLTHILLEHTRAKHIVKRKPKQHQDIRKGAA